MDLDKLSRQALIKFSKKLMEENARLKNVYKDNSPEIQIDDEEVNGDMDILFWMYFFVTCVLVWCYHTSNNPAKALIYQTAASFDIIVSTLTSDVVTQKYGFTFSALIFVMGFLPVAVQFYYFLSKVALRTGDSAATLANGGVILSVLVLTYGYYARYYHVIEKGNDHLWRPFCVVASFLVVSIFVTLDYIQSLRPISDVQEPRIKKDNKSPRLEASSHKVYRQKTSETTTLRKADCKARPNTATSKSQGKYPPLGYDMESAV